MIYVESSSFDFERLEAKYCTNCYPIVLSQIGTTSRTVLTCESCNDIIYHTHFDKDIICWKCANKYNKCRKCGNKL